MILKLNIIFYSLYTRKSPERLRNMDHITDKTQVSDLSQIHIPKCYENYVNKAIASSTCLLTIKEFIDITGFEVNAETFDILFMNINDEGIGVYIDETMLKWMGYNGDNTKFKMLSLKRHIERNFEENTDYKILKNKDYELFLNQERVKNQDTRRGILINKTYPIIMLIPLRFFGNKLQLKHF